MVKVIQMVAAVLAVATVNGEAPLRPRFSPSAKKRTVNGRSQGQIPYSSTSQFLTPPPPPPQLDDLSAGGVFLQAPPAQLPDFSGAASSPPDYDSSAFSGINHELTIGHSEKHEVPVQSSRRASFRSDSVDGPANYEFSYQVLDEPSGNDYGHQESRKEETARGSYHVLLPDGRRQVVDYEADRNGYRSQVHYEDSNRGGFTGSRKSSRF